MKILKRKYGIILSDSESDKVSPRKAKRLVDDEPLIKEGTFVDEEDEDGDKMLGELEDDSFNIEDDDESSSSTSNDDENDDRNNNGWDSSISTNEYDHTDKFIDDEGVDEDESDDDGSEGDEGDYEPFKSPDRYLEMISKDKGKGPRRTRKKKATKTDRDSDDFDFSDVQQVSIHKINMNHPKFSRFVDSINPEEKIIIEIIKKQNKKGETSSPKYEGQDVTKKPRMVLKDQELFKEDDDEEEFKIKIFLQIIPRRSALMSAYGVDASAQLCHTLIFHYRKDEIFVLTTNQAWNVVQWCSDFGFPGKVAARILSHHGTLESSKKGLIGTDYMSKQIYKQVEESNPFDLLSFTTNYTTVIQENASILKLDCFENERPDVDEEEGEGGESDDDDDDKRIPHHSKNSPPKKAKPIRRRKQAGVPFSTKVQISQAGVRFLKRFHPSDFLSILHHLSLISRGCTTTTLDNKNEQDSSAHMQYLQKVQFEVSRELDLELSKQIHNAIADNRYIPVIQNYEFAHKHFMDFRYGCDFILKFRRNPLKVWKRGPPTWPQVIEALREVDALVQVQEGSSEESYKKILDSVKLEYSMGDKVKKVGKKPEKILNFHQGMIHLASDNNVYWHIQGMWTFLHPGYVLLIQQQFLTMLRDHLGQADKVGLKHKWQSPEEDNDDEEEENLPSNHNNETTKIYLQQYAQLPSYFVSTTPGEDIVDMIGIRKDENDTPTFIIYFLSPNLSHNFLSCGLHLTSSLTSIRKAGMVDGGGGKHKRKKSVVVGVGGSEHNLQDIKELYEKVVENKKSFREAAPKFADFKQLLSTASIVLGIGQDPKFGRTLQEELEVPAKIEVADIQVKLHGKDDKIREIGETLQIATTLDNVAKFLHNLMLKNELIASDKTITSKLVALSPLSVPVPELRNFSEFLFEHIIQPFQPPVTTLMAKMELDRINKHISNLGIGKFIIAEIPYDDD